MGIKMNTLSSSSNSRSLFDPTSLFIGLIFAATSCYFLYWAMDYTQQNHILLLVLATIFGLFMAFNVGGNDVANSFGTSVGAGTLTIKQALLVAAVFEVSGAVIAGGEVTKTIRKGIVDLSQLDLDPMQFVYIMMASLLAAAIWLLIATKRGWPVSTTHSIIGGIIGSSVTLGFVIGGSETGFALVKWEKIGQIAISWVLSPVLGGAVASLLYYQIKHHVLKYNDEIVESLKIIKQKKHDIKEKHTAFFNSLSASEKLEYNNRMAQDAFSVNEQDIHAEDLSSEYYKELKALDDERAALHSTRALENWVPLISALGAMVISAMLLFKGLKHMDTGLTTLHNYLIVCMSGAVIWMATFIFAKTLKNEDLSKSTFLIFSWMQVFTAAGFAFSHGANDIANAIGPFAAVLDILRSGEIGTSAAVPTVAMITFGIALVAGLWFIGKDVIQTVGHNLTKMHPSSGFAAELSAAAVVMMASLMGLPVSSTHILIGAVLGVGMVNRNANWNLMKSIGMAWVITLPAAAILSGITFLLLSQL